ncbi:dihydroxyacetone kinase subunit DhaL [Feifania hominis]|uniref:phosphoenolpyruvate--glycerone phosphotransferase n=1 Tax=Feifania hominis TaxID=2763660 RepID=A0A926DFJ6_9FIRM|nr:dihydroxyacetone kinase subunit DhaL [Feifania hominis]MBC8536100.1 dihydroxyacetone kinase subunit L [Feifania hominis]
MQTISRDDVIALFGAIRDKMAASRDLLCELDSVAGDGDLGLTMAHGFTAVSDSMAASAEQDLGKLLMAAGMAMAEKVPSTMGTLMASAVMAAGKSVKGKTALVPADLPGMVQAAVEGIKKRGKAEQGDKTILDAMIPAAEAMGALGEQATAGEFASAGRRAAAEGVEQTKQMKPKFGRAAWYGEQNIGKQDPGATAALCVAEAVEAFFA